MKSSRRLIETRQNSTLSRQKVKNGHPPKQRIVSTINKETTSVSIENANFSNSAWINLYPIQNYDVLAYCRLPTVHDLKFSQSKLSHFLPFLFYYSPKIVSFG